MTIQIHLKFNTALFPKILWDLTVLEGKLGLNLLEHGSSIRMCWRQVAKANLKINATEN